jgi:hypothetical protein
MTSVRQVLDSVRYERLGVRIGGQSATVEGQWLVLIISMLVVFACFFAIGRLVHVGGGATHAEAPSTLHAPAGRAEIPGGLDGPSPIEGAIPVAIAAPPTREAPAQPRPQSISTGAQLSSVAPAQSFTAESASPASESQPSSAPASEPEPAPVQASTPSSSGGGSGSSSHGSATGGTHSPKRPSGGGSFDSSE